MDVHNLNLGAYLNFVSSDKVKDEDKFSLANASKLSKLSDGAGAKGHMIAPSNQESELVRHQLLNFVNKAFDGDESDAFQEIREKLIGVRKGLGDAKFVEQPLDKRDIKAIMEKTLAFNKDIFNEKLKNEIDDIFQRSENSMLLKFFDEGSSVSSKVGTVAADKAENDIKAQMDELKRLVNEKMAPSTKVLSMSDIAKIVSVVELLARKLRDETTTAGAFLAMNTADLSKLVDETITKLETEEQPVEQTAVEEDNNVPNEVKEDNADQQPEIKEDNVGQEEEIVKNPKPQTEQPEGVKATGTDVAAEPVAEVKDANAVGEKSKTLTADQMDTVKSLAAFAYGSGWTEGKDGGEGFMAIVDGKAVKFLTHGDERSDFAKGKVRFFDSDKKTLDDATNALEDQLLDIASGLDESRQARVKDLLKDKTELNGVKFLSRKTVAQVISVIAEEVKSFNWDDIKSVKSGKDMSLENVILKNDPIHRRALMTNLTEEQLAFLKDEREEYQKWYASQSSGGGSVDCGKILGWKVQRAFSADYQKKVMRLFGDLLRPIQGDGVLKGSNPSVQKEIPMLFNHSEDDGSSGSARVRATQKYGTKVIVGYQIAADATFFGGTLTGGGQEEALFVDMPAMNIAYLLHEKYIELSNKNGDSLSVEEFCKCSTRRFKYSLDENGDRKIKTWLGMGLPTFSYTTDGKPNVEAEPRAGWLVFTAATAFGTDTANIDRGGFMEVMKHRDKNPLMPGDVDSKHRANAFFDELHKAAGNLSRADLKFLYEHAEYDFGLSSARKWNALMILAHFHSGDKFNVFGEDSAAEFKKLVDLVRSGNYKQELEEAMESYKKLALHQNRLWRQLEARLGMDYEAHTNPGGTYFANPPDVTLGAAGEAFMLDGGQTIHTFYVYSNPEEGAKINASFERVKEQQANPVT